MVVLVFAVPVRLLALEPHVLAALNQYVHARAEREGDEALRARRVVVDAIGGDCVGLARIRHAEAEVAVGGAVDEAPPLEHALEHGGLGLVPAVHQHEVVARGTVVHHLLDRHGRVRAAREEVVVLEGGLNCLELNEQRDVVDLTEQRQRVVHVLGVRGGHAVARARRQHFAVVSVVRARGRALVVYDHHARHQASRLERVRAVSVRVVEEGTAGVSLRDGELVFDGLLRTTHAHGRVALLVRGD
mmetsp:Transcript_33530/g.77509  ORF Transcript_33530/g.77509 Transcript_33530/m.77509 type:complete len:245 (-) Transcript_33530:673-1407(-)